MADNEIQGGGVYDLYRNSMSRDVSIAKPALVIRVIGAVLLCTVILCTIMFATACNGGSASENSSDYPKEVVSDNADYFSGPEPETAVPALETVETWECGSPKNPIVFDFEELSSDVFPRGKWTINQLISKYGAPEEIKADYLPGYEIAIVRVLYEHISLFFLFEYADRFSFYKEQLEGGDHDLCEEDKKMELYIRALRIQSSGIELPRGIKVGQSTKTQIIEAYPADTYYWSKNADLEYYGDWIEYNYAFREEIGNVPGEFDIEQAGITYFFDENEVLAEVVIHWFFFDL